MRGSLHSAVFAMQSGVLLLQEMSETRQVATSTRLRACNAAALKKQCMGCGRTDEGMLRCSTCLRSWYCDRDCQRKNWESHKKQCHEVVIKTIQVAKSIKMNRINARLFLGMERTYYWGNVPAVDLLKLPMNDGEEYSNPLALVLCGVGDPRNVLLKIASLPNVYTQLS